MRFVRGRWVWGSATFSPRELAPTKIFIALSSCSLGATERGDNMRAALGRGICARATFTPKSLAYA